MFFSQFRRAKLIAPFRSIARAATFCLFLSPISLSLAQRADSVVTFNEIHYHPADETSETEWVELHNQMAVRVDLSGWSLTSGVEYTFPEGSIMEPGAYWVISSDPGHVSLSGLENVFGPFSGKLSNGGEVLILTGRHGRVMDEIEYEDDGLWPCAADGGAVTLAKLRPTNPSEWPSSWTWSLNVGGSPASDNFNREALDSAIVSEAQTRTYLSLHPNRGPNRSALRFSEVSGASDSDFVIEIENAGGDSIELGDFTINGFELPEAMLAAGDFLAYQAIDLNFEPSEDEILFLRSGDGNVADAVRVGESTKAFDSRRGMWQRPELETPSEANAFAYDDRIVINEIHYHNRPIYPDPVNGIETGEIDTEWLELYNRSDEVVDLSGWTIDDAIEYEFPDGATIHPGAFLVLDDGEFSKSLGNRNDRIVLLDSNENVADFVHYYDDIPWPKLADGDGSSLELIHPFADNSQPTSWAASDESSKSEWQTFSYRGLATEPKRSNNPTLFHEFLMGMLSRGEILIDDISLVEDPDGTALQLMQNGDFESDTLGESPAAWRILGNHLESHVVALPGGGKALRLIASAELEHSYNIASTTLADQREIDSAKTYEISFRAKWLAGSPQLNTHLYFNRMARTHILPQPVGTGTPGERNSTRIEAAPPSVSGLLHMPLVPMADESVAIQATVTAEYGIDSVTLHYNAGTEWASLPMSPDSSNRYTATVPGQADGAIVQFYVKAVANSGGSVEYPSGGRLSKALFRVGDRTDGVAEGTPVLRLITLPADADFLHTPRHVTNDRRIGSTVIYNDREVWYDAGIRLRGSPSGRNSPRLGWNVKFPADRPFRGAHETVSIDGGYSIPIGDGTGWISGGAGIATNELVYNQIAHRAGGVPATHDDIAYVEAPRASDDKRVQLKMARFKKIWQASSFPDGDEGTSYEFEAIYYPSSTIDGDPESPKSNYDEIKSITIRDMGADKEAYRYNFLIKDHEEQDNFQPIIDAATALNNTENLGPATEAVLDVDNWLRVMAMQALTGTIDTYNNRGHGHNLLLFNRPTDKKTMIMPWDVDHAFYAATDDSLFGKGNSEFAAVIEIPTNRRRFLGHLLDLSQTGFDPGYIADWVTHFNGVSEQPDANRYIEWIGQRREFVLSQLEVEQPREAFRITTNDG